MEQLWKGGTTIVSRGTEKAKVYHLIPGPTFRIGEEPERGHTVLGRREIQRLSVTDETKQDLLDKLKRGCTVLSRKGATLPDLKILPADYRPHDLGVAYRLANPKAMPIIRVLHTVKGATWDTGTDQICRVLDAHGIGHLRSEIRADLRRLEQGTGNAGNYAVFEVDPGWSGRPYAICQV